ncbi:hypothetical protein BDV19DRAFT_395460 [Aspergillus venezuelensis]
MALRHDDYTVAWICALPLEMAAAKIMLDKHHPTLAQPETDHNTYILGNVGNHNVVVACLPSGVYGITSAAIVLAQMLPTFPCLRFVLMVGIGGGVPNGKNDIRLGDVVVSVPTATSGGVIQYDYGKTVHDGRLHRTGSLNKPPQYLLTAISQIRCETMVQGSQTPREKQEFTKLLDQGQESNELFRRPVKDWLFKPSYDHPRKNPDCSLCDESQLVVRTPRVINEPMIHYGLIASGNQVMKDARTRDTIGKDLDILCFEMEAAGLMDQRPCLVIRGICDYSDSHKHKEWQGYAALTAATYAGLLLSKVPAVAKGREEQRVGFTAEESRCFQSLFVTDPEEDKNILRRRKGDRAAGTCEWIMKTDELIDWLKASGTGGSTGSNILWLHGHPGTGKSTMVLTMTDELSHQFSNSNKILAYFFCDSSSEKQRTAVAMLRGLIYRLVKECPILIKHLVAKYVERRESLYMSFDALWAVLMEMSSDRAIEVYCIIDALDECESDSQEIFLRQVRQSFGGARTTNTSSYRPHILITSRPYPEIRQYMSSFRNKDLASYDSVKNDLKIMIQEKVTDLSNTKQYPDSVAKKVSQILEIKSEGTFLWIGIACDQLTRVQSRNAIKTLGEMPSGLYALYQQLLNTALVDRDDANDDKEVMIDMMRFVAFARRPLTMLELTALCQLYPDEDEASRLQFTKDLIDQCRLMIVIEGDNVRLLHKSVRDFLVKEELHIDEQSTHADMANHCINRILHSVGDTKDKEVIFLVYAVRYWPEHAGHAKTSYIIGPDQESFFRPESQGWKEWIQRYNVMAEFGVDRLENGFCTLHAAARWGIIPLLKWGLKVRALGVAMSYSSERTYDDAEYQTTRGRTPLEETAREGQIEAMNILLNRMQVGQTVAKGVITAAAGNLWNGKDTMALLLDQQGDEIQITEEVVKAAAGNRKDIMALLLDRRGDKIQITEEVVQAAAGNSWNGKDIMDLLLDQRGDEFQITKEVIQAAARNSGDGKEIMALLLNRRGDEIQITEDVVQAAARNLSGGKEIMALLLDRRGDEIQITEDVVQAAARNEWNGKEIMALLLDRQGDKIQITEEVVQAAARNLGEGKEIMALLLDQQGDKIQITEEVVKAAAGNKQSGKEILKFLLDQQGDEIQITEDVVQAAAGNSGDGKEIMTLLLDQQGDKIQITEDVVKAAVGEYGSRKEIMALLLDQQGYKIQITEDVVQAAAGNEWDGKEIITLLLDQQGDKIQITEEVVKAAAGNIRNGKEIITLLLDRQGDKIQITEDVVQAAVMNSGNGKEIMALLLDQRGDEIQITEDVVQAAAGNKWNGKDIMTLLLDQQGDEIQITKEVIQAAAGNRKDIMALLLDRRGDEIQITEEVVQAAAGNSWNGKEIMTLLLDQRGDEIQITEEVVKAAAGNERSGKKILTLLFERLGVALPVTQDALLAAASCGNDDALHLLEHRAKHPISLQLYTIAQFYKAAAAGDNSTLQKLLRQGVPLDTQNIQGITPLWIASHHGHEKIANTLIETKQVNLNTQSTNGRSPLHEAAAWGHIGVMRVLLGAHADPNLIDSNGNTSYNLATKYGNWDIARLLRKHSVATSLPSVLDMEKSLTKYPRLPRIQVSLRAGELACNF